MRDHLEKRPPVWRTPIVITIEACNSYSQSSLAALDWEGQLSPGG